MLATARVPLEELFAFYRAAGFPYPAKPAALEARRPQIEDTWRRLLAASEDVFKLVTHRSGDGTLADTASAYAFASGTWQGQSLVSRARREHTGTLAVLIELVEWFQRHGAAHGRLGFSPTDPWTNRLFGAVAARLPSRLACLSVADYGLVPLDRVYAVPDRRVHVTAGAPALARGFYARTLHPVEAASLRLDDPGLSGLAPAYEKAGLHRTRTVLVATLGAEVAGAALVSHASEGIDLSFLENAIEHLRVASWLSPRARRSVWTTLLGAAAELAFLRGHEYVVVTADPRDRDLAVAAGVVAEQPKQYATLTIGEAGFTRALGCWMDHYDALQAAKAA